VLIGADAAQFGTLRPALIQDGDMITFDLVSPLMQLAAALNRDGHPFVVGHDFPLTSNVPRNRAVVRRLIRQINRHLIHVTPSPPFRRIVAFDDGMPGLVEMLGRMAVGRVVTTAHVPAGTAKPQVYPPRPNLQTFFASQGTGCDVYNGTKMRTLG
jgi:hypothetical protein